MKRVVRYLCIAALVLAWSQPGLAAGTEDGHVAAEAWAQVTPRQVKVNEPVDFTYSITLVCKTADKGVDTINIDVPTYKDISVTRVIADDRELSQDQWSATLDKETLCVSLLTAVRKNARIVFHATSTRLGQATFNCSVRSSLLPKDSSDNFVYINPTVEYGMMVDAVNEAPCTSASYEIYPHLAKFNEQTRFQFYVQPLIQPHNTGVKQVEVRYPEGYTITSVESVKVGEKLLTPEEYIVYNSLPYLEIELVTVLMESNPIQITFEAIQSKKDFQGIHFSAAIASNSGVGSVVWAAVGDVDGDGIAGKDVIFRPSCTIDAFTISPNELTTEQTVVKFAYTVNATIAPEDEGIKRLYLDIPSALTFTSDRFQLEINGEKITKFYYSYSYANDVQLSIENALLPTASSRKVEIRFLFNATPPDFPGLLVSHCKLQGPKSFFSSVDSPDMEVNVSEPGDDEAETLFVFLYAMGGGRFENGEGSNIVMVEKGKTFISPMAVPYPGYEFVKWTGPGIDSKQNPLVLPNITDDIMDIMAIFKPNGDSVPDPIEPATTRP